VSADSAPFRRTVMRVLAAELFVFLMLGLLQARYTR
jgi:hypothetical protein